jgi:hypothetical protein
MPRWQTRASPKTFGGAIVSGRLLPPLPLVPSSCFLSSPSPCFLSSPSPCFLSSPSACVLSSPSSSSILVPKLLLGNAITREAPASQRSEATLHRLNPLPDSHSVSPLTPAPSSRGGEGSTSAFPMLLLAKSPSDTSLTPRGEGRGEGGNPSGTGDKSQ